ncbi:hypothetical protein ARMA_0893 [Ardenticatena maritima]|uniref:Peptidase M23 domain-containing protein n=1 Tax=Ardenticatena maritima TaxID=872965 RepID=A0A0M9UC54_9CHLR|nr:M23 family metallopeptidase [Ardenticatena maritima]KPL89420.1 hypothetical protein SE16_02940 [Ardenticatena maritima]GAP62470.1 hypothetical protein ARMA_0893 [Ardenticatena maritima]
MSIMRRLAFIVGAGLIVGLGVWAWKTAAWQGVRLLWQWQRATSDLNQFAVHAGMRCGDAPMRIPTDGLIVFGWGDSFRPGHRHTGFDIFGPGDEEGVVPVVAAYDGYLTRESTWRSAVIIRHENVPGAPTPVIWTYYAHMASSDGETSFIAPAFPPGTHERFVEAGTLLGYQGRWSGNPRQPTGLHLHFSVVKSTPNGGYANETILENTYDPAPFLGVEKQNDLWVCQAGESRR